MVATKPAIARNKDVDRRVLDKLKKRRGTSSNLKPPQHFILQTGKNTHLYYSPVLLTTTNLLAELMMEFSSECFSSTLNPCRVPSTLGMPVPICYGKRSIVEGLVFPGCFELPFYNMKTRSSTHHCHRQQILHY